MATPLRITGAFAVEDRTGLRSAPFHSLSTTVSSTLIHRLLLSFRDLCLLLKAPDVLKRGRSLLGAGSGGLRPGRGLATQGALVT